MKTTKLSNLLFLLLLSSCNIQISRQENAKITRVININYSDCNNTKICFGVPNNCVITNNCNFMVAISRIDGTFTFELESTIDSVRYVAVGLSTDQNMLDDSIIECVLENETTISTYASWTVRAPSNALRDVVPQNIIRKIEGSFIDGSLYCKVERDANSTILNNVFDLENENYYLLIATGINVNENGIAYHQFREPSEFMVNFTTVENVSSGGSRSMLINVHACLMTLSWIGTGSIGMILARYFKKTWVGSQLGGKDQWFAWHTILMSLTWIMHMTAFIIIFIHVNGWSEVDNPHAILGVCATIFCFFQPIGAAFRPAPTAAHRKYFNRGHWFGGTVSHAFAIITMFFAVTLPSVQLPNTFYALLGVFLVIYCIAHCCFSISLYRANRKNPIFEIDSKWPSKKDDENSSFRKILLVVYSAVVIGLAGGLMSLILS